MEIDWQHIRENYPNAFFEYMKKDWDLEDFWTAYGILCQLTIEEYKTGEELFHFKIESKLVFASVVCSKTIIKDGKKYSVYTIDEARIKSINKIFDTIERQCKNENYLNN